MEKVPLFGFEFWNASNEQEVADVLTTESTRQELFAKDNINFLITPNAFDITQYHTRYKSIFRFFQNAGVVLPDGMPIVWLSRLNNRKNSLKQRLTGSDLFPLLWQKIKKNKQKAFFILPSHAIGRQLQTEYPLIQYIVPAYFNAGDDGDTYIETFIETHIQAIKNFQPEFIFIGITLPKQQKIAMRLHHHLSGKVRFNCLIAMLGASFEFYLGLKKRAPVFLQKSGFEWLYRFVLEPKRTWKRYTFGNLVFIRIAIKELFSNTTTKIAAAKPEKIQEITTPKRPQWIGENLISKKEFN